MLEKERYTRRMEDLEHARHIKKNETKSSVQSIEDYFVV